MEEKAPLLDFSKPENSNLLPPILHINYNQNKQSAGSYYGLIEIPPNEAVIQFEARQRRQNQTSSSFPAIIATAVGIALVCTLALTFFSGGGSTVNLQAAAPLPSNSKSHLAQSPPEPSHVDIEIPQGRLRGYKKRSRDGREYSAFYKVPYAAPPIGSLRFKDPSPPSSWQGLRDIPVVAPQCIQKEKYADTPTAGGDEDCLYANVYTPGLPQTQTNEDSSKLFPVMVYIHGGGFATGNGSRYSPEYFMDEDVVIITFQFRLGLFGFLSTGDEVIHGNQGQKDQVQMLKWTRDNAKYFNGNPDLITIFGNSGGGHFTGELLLSPMANGLFHRAICQSGTSIFGYGPDLVFEDIAKLTMNEVGKATNCSTEDSQKYLECLLEKDAKELALISGPKINYVFTLENWSGGDDSTKFISERPLTLIESGRFHPVPLMVGNVNAEYHGDGIVILQDKNLTREANENFEDFAPKLLKKLDADEMSTVRKFYFGEKSISNSTLINFGEMISDASIVHSSYVTARHHATQADAYLYWLTKPPAKSYMEKTVPGFPVKEYGFVNHADELQYLFLYDGYPEIPKDDPEYYQFSKYLVKLWVHFAKTGNPTMDGIEWRPVNGFGDGYTNSTFWLELNDKPASTTVLQERMGFWDQFGQP